MERKREGVQTLKRKRRIKRASRASSDADAGAMVGPGYACLISLSSNPRSKKD